MVVLTTMIGFAVLVIGRQLLWVFVAGLAFALSLVYGGQYLIGQPDWMILLISSIIAILGAILAYVLQRLAAGIAGFATGWYLSILAIGYIQADLGQYETFIPIIAGLLCALLVMVFFDWGVIILSAFAGAAIIFSGISVNQQTEMILMISFALLGMGIQTILYIQEDNKKN